MVRGVLKPGCGNLYLICDGETCAKHNLPLVDFFRASSEAGVKTIQYRHKGISTTDYEANLVALIPVAKKYRVSLIVNDYAALAQKYALPVHLGQDDALPPKFNLPYGRSTHNMEEVKAALDVNPPPHYLALGAIFSSATKPGVVSCRNALKQALDILTLPLVLIGGITLDNVSELPASSKIFYAVISDVFRFGNDADAIKKYVETFAAWSPAPL